MKPVTRSPFKAFNEAPPNYEDSGYRNHLACTAHGCPMPGSRKAGEDRWFCSAHIDKSAQLWDEITRRLRINEALIMACFQGYRYPAGMPSAQVRAAQNTLQTAAQNSGFYLNEVDQDKLSRAANPVVFLAHRTVLAILSNATQGMGENKHDPRRGEENNQIHNTMMQTLERAKRQIQATL